MEVDRKRLTAQLERLTNESIKLQTMLQTTSRQKEEIDTTIIIIRNTLSAIDKYEILIS